MTRTTAPIVVRALARPALGFALLVSATWLAAPALRQLLGSAAVAGADRAVAAWLHAHVSGGAVDLLRAVTALHGTAGILVLATIAAWLLQRSGGPPPWPLPMLAVPAGLLLNASLKHLVQRVRPDWGYAYEALESFSFPSGHTAGATMFYGLLAAWAWTRHRHAAARWAWAAGALLAVLLVATSRIVLGVHFFSDCIAALFEGMAWVAICLPRSESPTDRPAPPPPPPP